MRLWEIAAGCYVFLLKRDSNSSKNPTAEQATASIGVALAALIAVLFLPRAISPYNAVLCVALTSLLLKINNHESSSWFFLLNKRFTYIGKLSYSLYLWHWGVISISQWTVGVNKYTVIPQIIFTALIAWASYKFIESPFRKAPFADLTAKTTNCFFLIAVLVPSITIKLISSLNNNIFFIGSTGSNTKDSAKEAGIRGSSITISNCNKFDSETITRCLAKGAEDSRSLLVMGDSFSTMIYPLLEYVHESFNMNIYAYNSVGASRQPYPGQYWSTQKYSPSLEKERDTISGMNSFFQEAQKKLGPGDIALFSSAINMYFADNSFKLYDDDFNPISQQEAITSWLEKLLKVAATLNKKGVAVVVIAPFPRFFEQGSLPVFPDSACNEQWFRIHQNRKECIMKTNRIDLIKAYEPLNKGLLRVQKISKNIFIFDPFNSFCPDKDTACFSASDERGRVFSDLVHINKEGNSLIQSEFARFIKNLDVESKMK
jgi:hypothetical protein